MSEISDLNTPADRRRDIIDEANCEFWWDKAMPLAFFCAVIFGAGMWIGIAICLHRFKDFFLR